MSDPTPDHSPTTLSAGPFADPRAPGYGPPAHGSFAPPGPLPYPPVLPAAPSPRRASRTWLWVALGVVATVGVGAMAFALMNGSGSSNGNSRSDVAEFSEGPAPSFVPPTDGERVTGTSGWAMQTPPGWEPGTAPTQLIEAVWFVPGSRAGFADNVNVGFERPSVALDLRAYLDLSLRNLPRLLQDAEVLSVELLTRADGSEYGRMEYTAPMAGGLHFIAIVVAIDDGFAFATLATSEETYSAQSRVIEPYLLTLAEA